jgi:hypothetical protein
MAAGLAFFAAAGWNFGIARGIEIFAGLIVVMMLVGYSVWRFHFRNN